MSNIHCGILAAPLQKVKPIFNGRLTLGFDYLLELFFQLVGGGAHSLSAMIRFLFTLLFLLPAIVNSLQLNLLSTSNVSSSIASSEISAINATRLTTHNACYAHSEEHTFPTTKSDCERALDRLVNGQSLVEVHHFGYHTSRVTDRLPVEAEYGSCNIVLMTFDLDTRIALTYAELYSELLGPDGVLKDCLGPDVPALEALGGQTALGPRHMLVAEVTGQPKRIADQKSR